MTTANQIQQANEAFEKFGHIARFKTEIEKGLNEINGFIKKELKISKDLRDVEYLTKWLNHRHYYKTILKKYAK